MQRLRSSISVVPGQLWRLGHLWRLLMFLLCYRCWRRRYERGCDLLELRRARCSRLLEKVDHGPNHLVIVFQHLRVWLKVQALE